MNVATPHECELESYEKGKQNGVRLSMNLVQSLSKIAGDPGYKQALEDITQILQNYIDE